MAKTQNCFGTTCYIKVVEEGEEGTASGTLVDGRPFGLPERTLLTNHHVLPSFDCAKTANSVEERDFRYVAEFTTALLYTQEEQNSDADPGRSSPWGRRCGAATMNLSYILSEAKVVQHHVANCAASCAAASKRDTNSTGLLARIAPAGRHQAQAPDRDSQASSRGR